MSFILNIETSANICSVALSKNNMVINELNSEEPLSHSKLLSVFIQTLLQRNGITVRQLSAVAISSGPGSYTGLRIGTATAKGICFAANIPLLEVDTFKAMAISFLSKNILPQNALVCPLIDARRNDVYFGIYNTSGDCIVKTSFYTINDSFQHNILNHQPIYFFGNAATKCQSIIQHTNAYFSHNFLLTASCLVLVAYNEFINKNFQNIITYNPLYLKEFVAIPAKNSNIINSEEIK